MAGRASRHLALGLGPVYVDLPERRGDDGDDGHDERTQPMDRPGRADGGGPFWALVPVMSMDDVADSDPALLPVLPRGYRRDGGRGARPAFGPAAGPSSAASLSLSDTASSASDTDAGPADGGRGGRSGRAVKTTARLVAEAPPEQSDPNGELIDGAALAGGIDVPPNGSILCGRDHKTCQLWIADIHCSRRQAEVSLDRRTGRVYITRVRGAPFCAAAWQGAGVGVGGDRRSANGAALARPACPRRR